MSLDARTYTKSPESVLGHTHIDTWTIMDMHTDHGNHAAHHALAELSQRGIVDRIGITHSCAPPSTSSSENLFCWRVLTFLLCLLRRLHLRLEQGYVALRHRIQCRRWRCLRSF